MNFISKSYALISLTRFLNVLITFCSVIVAVIICGHELIIPGKYLLAALSASLSAAAGYVINDFFDLQADLINKPERPLPSGKVSKKAAVVFYLVLLLLSMFSAYIINWIVFLIVFLTDVLLFLYSSGLKRIPLLGNLVISFLTGFVFIFGGIVAGNIYAAVIPSVFAFLLNLSREGIKTIEDIPGDKNTGIITFPQRYGVNLSKKLIAVLLIVLLLFTFVPFIRGVYGIKYLIVVMAIVNPLISYVIISLLGKEKPLKLKKLNLILKLNMIFGLAAIYLG
jgi:geranylgeranylglycerol-phosphate geranylgeranyltransferase